MTIRSSSIFEIFNHHDAILGLANNRAKIKPESLSWNKFTKFWNNHAAEDGPRFVTWDTKTGVYIYPLEIVTLVDFNLTHRAPSPKVISDLTPIPKVDTDASKLKGVLLNVSSVSRTNSVASTTTTTTSATASESGISALDLWKQNKKRPVTTSPVDVVSPSSSADVTMSDPVDANKPSALAAGQKSASGA